MYSLILKITHNTRIKDAIAVARGIYRVSEAVYPLGSPRNPQAHSWMNSIAQKNLSQQTSGTKKQFQPIGTEKMKQNLQITNSENEKVKVAQEKNCGDKISVPQDTNTQLGGNAPIQQNLKDKELKGSGTAMSQSIRVEKMQKNKEEDSKSYLRQFKLKEYSNKNENNPQTSAITSSRIGRIFQFGKLGLSLASATIFSKDKDQSYYQDIAEKVSNQLCKMRGAPLKLAQMLSIQEESLIPTPIRRAFEKARQSAHVIPREEVQFMMKKNLGDNWSSKFKQFYSTPVASASIGQVHKAVLQNGNQVAVKVQYYQVKESIESDIQNLGLLMRLPGIFPKGMYVQKILKNTRLELIQQCDYLLEKWYQQRYGFYLEKSFGAEAKLYKVPKVYSQYTTAEVLTSQFITGIKMKDLQDEGYSQQLRNQIGRRIMKLTFKQLFQMGIMQSDPNPSNFTYNHIKDQLNLYDFGATHVYKKQFLQSYYQIIEGSVKSDEQQIWKASIQTGFVTGQQNMAMKKSHIESIMITGQPLRSAGLYDFGSQEITNRIYKTIPLMLKNRLRPPPEQVYSLHRKLSGSYLACIRLKAKVDCKKIFEQIKFQTMASNQKYDTVDPGSSNLQN